MATDYDSPRTPVDDELAEDALQGLTGHRDPVQSAVVDADEADSAGWFELSGADLSEEELSVGVIPKRADEFTCSCCYLVYHRSRLARVMGDYMICVDCVS
ncbi:MAG TPA: DUF4193 domain-containing protein [Mycobacterium sp.]|nr:DUF4193 domain-containing protein [Mycobacterium sp.]